MKFDYFHFPSKQEYLRKNNLQDLPIHIHAYAIIPFTKVAKKRI